jgi:hypothetical protein
LIIGKIEIQRNGCGRKTMGKAVTKRSILKTPRLEEELNNLRSREMAKKELKGRKNTRTDIKLDEHANMRKSEYKTENRHGCAE